MEELTTLILKSILPIKGGTYENGILEIDKTC
jgi:hypothetical protein